MNNLFSATIRLTSSKCCFVSLSTDLAQRLPASAQDPGNIIVFKAEWPGGLVFVSWSGDVTVNSFVGPGQPQSSVIEIGRKYANLNGINNGQQVVLTLIDKTSAPSCILIHVDPFSPDDWEILELHAGFIESDLLNQVRVVWKGQVIPIWVNKTTCICIIIGVTEPSAACVVLEEFTEVIVAPKQRNFAPSEMSGLSSFSKNEQEAILQAPQTKHSSTFKSQVKYPESSFSNTNNSSSGSCNSNKESSVPKFFNWWSYFLYGDQEADEPSQDDSSNNKQKVSTEGSCNEENWKGGTSRSCCVTFFRKVELELCVRSQGEMNCFEDKEKGCSEADISCLAPFTVYVHPITVGFSKINCGKDHLVVFPEDYEGLTKIVRIRRILSPKEKLDLMNINKGESEGNEARNEGNKDVLTVQEKSYHQLAVVKMVLTKHALPGHIAMHSLLQKQLGSLGTSRFVISHVKYKPQDIQGIILHPVTGSFPKIDSLGHEVVIGSFHDWVSQTSNELCPLVLWDRAMVTYNCHGHSLELIVEVLSSAQNTANSENVIPYYNVTPCTLDRIKVVIGDVKSRWKPTKLLQGQTGDKAQFCCSISNLGGFDEPFHKCMRHLMVTLAKDPLSTHLSGGLTAGLGNGAVLICGSGTHVGEGCGKTSLAHALCHRLQQWPICAYINVIDCIPLRGEVLSFQIDFTLLHFHSTLLVQHLYSMPLYSIQFYFFLYSISLPFCFLFNCIPSYIPFYSNFYVMFIKAKKVETIQRQWQQAFMEAAWHQPSVILLDNLDHVISAPNLTQEMGGEAFYRKRLVEVFKDLVATEVTNKSLIAVIATSRSRDSLHPALQSGRGSHIFQCCVKLGTLSEKQKMEVLSIMIKKKFKEVDRRELDNLLRSVAKTSEGFSPKDLSRLTDRAMHFSVVRKINRSKESCQPSLILSDFSQALSGFIPASLQGVHLHKAGDLSWSSVGGLSQVKQALKETLLWPSKYGKIFSKCPLRLRSGLLLYGPPGTGKTLLAGVVAKESGLNFISIKGPELLSKYIGASEQAVRDVFTRAQTAKPCILFFDEFDSLAPRRGHDSTGVTDRVVNQLLTHLDGVEGLEGVYILAATSRPGLIDPALLRPGRLDKCLYCPIPNKSERLEILLALTHTLPLSDNVDLKSLAEKCEHFTGADLKALLYNAQLESIHRSTSKMKLYGSIFNTKHEIKQEKPEDKKEFDHKIQESYIAFSISGEKRILSREDKDAIQTKELASVQRKNKTQENIIYISQSDLEKACSLTRPSVSPNERLVYENIYDSFIKSRGGSFTKNFTGEGKTTLA